MSMYLYLFPNLMNQTIAVIFALRISDRKRCSFYIERVYSANQMRMNPTGG